MDRDLEWIREDEREAVDALRAEHAAELQTAPAEMSHDLCLARFLRAQNGDAAVASDRLGKAIQYRRGVIEKDAYVREVRERAAQHTTVDLTLLPHWEQVLRILPLRSVDGKTAVEALPLTCNATRLLDFDALDKLPDDVLDEFLRSQLEQRWLVLHNLSVQEERMAKFCEIRDLNGVSMGNLIMRGVAFISKLKEKIGVVQDFYPEMVHKVFVLNAPNTFSQAFALISPLLNERMRNKIHVFGNGMSFADISGMFQARAIWSWVSQTAVGLPFAAGIDVGAGSQEYTVRWLEAGQTASWQVVAKEGGELLFHRAFLPAPDSSASDQKRSDVAGNDFVFGDAVKGELRPDIEGFKVGPEKPVLEGSFKAPRDGVLWLCLDNSSSWVSSKSASLTISEAS